MAGIGLTHATKCMPLEIFKNLIEQPIDVHNHLLKCYHGTNVYTAKKNVIDELGKYVVSFNTMNPDNKITLYENQYDGNFQLLRVYDRGRGIITNALGDKDKTLLRNWIGKLLKNEMNLVANTLVSTISDPNTNDGGARRRTNTPYEKRTKAELLALARSRKLKGATAAATKPQLIAILRGSKK